MAPTEGDNTYESSSFHIAAAAEPVAETDRLGDEIAELSAHIEAAGAHVLDLIREFDARGGWDQGFRTCAHWLNWRVGLDLGEPLDVGYAIDVLHPRALQPLAMGE